jgi:hypothetical protein
MFFNKIKLVNWRFGHVNVVKKLRKIKDALIAKYGEANYPKCCNIYGLFADYLLQRFENRAQEWMTPEIFVREVKCAAYDLEQGKESWFGKEIRHPLAGHKNAVRTALRHLPQIIDDLFPSWFTKKAKKEFYSKPLLLNVIPPPWYEKEAVEKALQKGKITQEDWQFYLEKFPKKVDKFFEELKKKRIRNNRKNLQFPN